MKRIFFLVLVACFSSSIVANAQKYHKNLQISFISPMGTNGHMSKYTQNDLSLNILGGHSYGNNYFELGGLYNINFNKTQGLQIAGLYNHSGYSENSLQIAGLCNNSKSGKSVMQIAGIMNNAEYVDGIQVAGIMNNAEYVNGIQVAGILNIAKKVNGIQLGLINYSEKCNGTPIGLVNIVKEDGVHDFSISFSESLNTDINFRLGTKHFYTIFSAGAAYVNTNKTEFAFGGGFGSEISWEKGWGNHIEILAYSLSKRQSFKTEGINMLTQIRMPISKKLSKYITIFAGPTVNLTISKDTEDFINNWSLWRSNNKNIFTNGWIGIVAGIRFFNN